jgi:hypothetical protein
MEAQIAGGGQGLHQALIPQMKKTCSNAWKCILASSVNSMNVFNDAPKIRPPFPIYSFVFKALSYFSLKFKILYFSSRV